MPSNIKGLNRPAKHPKSTSWAGEDVSDVQKKTWCMKQTAVHEKRKPARPNKPSAAQVQSNASDRLATAEDPSASRAPPTPVDKPRRVGPASRTTGTTPRGASRVKEVQLQGKKCGREDAEQGSPPKCARAEVKSKKRSAEDHIQELPAKRTRSKTAKVARKRSKKPNSRYAGNFVKS
ncbi:hypothetical protein CY34DRAFT_19293 [Suillus luteus UH-Slu-Lm8-n1]|uniref:Uncharacterized protein n=1 Tax=Suillus luteus UH-Slu-Lm8-n1 TaxID=930992 RepID=A0A0D0AJI5_9AGAM|nr:hypothetical protein CY34DRAFT_19293 [Suillus luteus UH-Slu-Lm8-n1]